MDLNCDNIGSWNKRTCGDSQSIVGIITNGIVCVFVEGSIVGEAGMTGNFRAIYVNGVGIVVGDRDSKVHEGGRIRNVG